MCGLALRFITLFGLLVLPPALAGWADQAWAQAVPEPRLVQIEVGAPGTVWAGSGSLSPDGRWLMLERGDFTQSSLWIAPAAGGEPVRLTEDGYRDVQPVWAGSGDRIYFVSNRPSRGEVGTFVMSLAMDPRTGRATGSPRQVTLERDSNRPAPSPDGRLVAYRTGSEVRVVPANGGSSRVVTKTTGGNAVLQWEADGSAIYLVQRDVELPGAVLYRVPASGGTPARVVAAPKDHGIPAASPSARLIATQRLGPGPRERTIEILDFSGRVVARKVMERNVDVGAFSPDGRSLLLRQRDVDAVVRVRPVRGGDARDLVGGGAYDWPGGWTADSKGVIVASREGGPVVRILSLDGSPPRVIPLPSDGQAVVNCCEATPTHVAYSLPLENGQSARMMALDLATGERTVLSESSGDRGGPILFGPGGLYRDVDGFLFHERTGDRIDIKSGRPGSPPRIIHSAAAAVATNSTFAYQGERVAYFQRAGDSVAVMLSDHAGAPARVLTMLGASSAPLALPAAPACCRGVLAFSYDGQWLAVFPFRPEAAGEALVLRVPPRGRATEIRRIPVGAEYWYEPRWLPDGSGFTVIAGSGATAWVVFVPMAPGESARNLTRSEGTPTWGQLMSPDGRWVAYPAEIWRGTKLWRMDLSSVSARRD